MKSMNNSHFQHLSRFTLFKTDIEDASVEIQTDVYKEDKDQLRDSESQDKLSSFISNNFLYQENVSNTILKRMKTVSEIRIDPYALFQINAFGFTYLMLILLGILVYREDFLCLNNLMKAILTFTFY